MATLTAKLTLTSSTVTSDSINVTVTDTLTIANKVIAPSRIKTSTTGDTDIIQYASGTFATGEKALFGVQREAGSTGLVKLFKNGSLLPVAAAASGDGNNSGAISFDVVAMRNDDRHFDGKIYEMIVYETADLKTSEIDKINNYLINKHGL